MNWFTRKADKPAFTVCQECRKHFEPYICAQGFKNYCPEHRQPLLAAESRKRAFMQWAESNMERLDKIRVKEQKREAAKRKKSGYSEPNYFAGLQYDALKAGQRQINWQSGQARHHWWMSS